MRNDYLTKRGFTLIELLVVLAIISIISCLLLPASARTRIKSSAAGCLSNKRQMMIAWDMYAADNGDYMVGNAPLGSTTASWIFSSSESWSVSEANTNAQYYINPSLAALASYLEYEVGPFKCPADVLPSVNGIRLRSISMVGSMGGVAESGSVQNYNAPGVVFSKLSDLTRLPPAAAIVFVDETMCTLNDGYLQIDTQGTDGFFPDCPANYHDGAGSFGYADGHAEIHKWQTSPLITLPYSQSIGWPSFPIAGVPGVSSTNADWLWWCQHVDYNK